MRTSATPWPRSARTAGEGSEQSTRLPPLPHTRLDSLREAPPGVWLRLLADRRRGVFGYYPSPSARRVMLVQSRQSRLKVGLLRSSVAEPTEASRSRKSGRIGRWTAPAGQESACQT